MPSCAQCHRDVPAGARFCPFCGTALDPKPTASAADDPFIGRMVKGKYFIQQHLATGGMGQVYKALHTTLDVSVALKILNRALLADGNVVQRFYREARSASRLRHPNVIGVTDFGEMEDGALFMVMEFVAGRNLARVIAEDFPISEPRIVRIGTQILAALSEAHAQGIVHRDLKPENVMIESRRDEPDSVKVLDFGIAKVRQAGEASTLTQHGLVCGTPGYMSPEQWEGEDLDARSDLYAVGVILYQMLTGRLPFDARTPGAMHRQQLEGRPPPPSQLREDHSVSGDLEALVLRALSPERDGRPATADEMRGDLLACVVLPDPAERPDEGAQRTVVMAAASPPPVAKRLNGPRADSSARTKRGLEVLTPGRLVASRAAAAATPPRGAARATPGSTRRPTPGSLGARPAPRHELDEAEEEAAPPPPPPRRRGWLLATSVVALAVIASAAVAFLRLGGTRLLETFTRPASAVRAPSLQVAVAPPAAPASGPEAPQPRADLPRRASGEDPRPPGTPEPPQRAAGEAPRPVVADGPARRADEPAQRVGDDATPAAPPRAPERTAAASSDVPRAAPARRAPSYSAPRARLPTKATEVARAEQPREAPRPERRGAVLAVTDVINAFPTPPRESGEGVLSVQADPFGDVYLDGKSYGETPREFRLSAGTYRIRATHPQLGEREGTIAIHPGDRARWTADFMK